MAHLAPADRIQIEQIYRESHPLWAAGLPLSDYLGVWDELAETAWARRHLTFLVWQDRDGTLLSSVKLYRPMIRAGTTVRRGVVLGAIFTPRARRREGHARAMLVEVLEQERRRGTSHALLFSDIGSSFYGDLGFRALPAFEHRAELARLGRRAPENWTLEPLREEEWPEVRQAHRDGVERRRMGLVRDEEHWEFLRKRSRSYFRRLRDPDVEVQELVAREGGRFAGYLMAVGGRGTWSVREVGAVGGDPARTAAIVRLGAAQGFARGLRRLCGWLPPEILPELSREGLREQQRHQAVPMLFALRSDDGPPSLQDPAVAFLSFQDQF